ncbi:protein SNORC [Syngnathoides biaculeatus]|uniref:protein SNORC n=1 Tax=Syngnathoides biaculeatus TaxID=300417 RepID=UPI002ADE673D|nr:protein SNORC [Syngnathoides biaculeatus]
MSGETPADVGPPSTTTNDPLHHMTEQAFTFDYEDATQGLAMEDEEGVLGPGAITAIVIAVFLGASVLLALIVITLRKFTAS